MSWRVVTIESPAYLTQQQGSLVIKGEEVAKLPIEDIDALIIDNYAVTMSANLLGELSTSGVATVVCDSRHMPCSITTPLSQHSRQAKISHNQIDMAQPLRKNLWQTIVKQKIINQAAVLKQFNHEEAAANLIKLASQVRSGDSTNRESIAARLYFAKLLDDATRRQPAWYNSALNYCYALVRSLVARSIAVRGLIPSVGLFHHNQLNSFNLADDLIEPYRACVDKFVITTMADRRQDNHDDSSLRLEDRHLAIDIINNHVIIGNKQHTFHNAVDITIESLVKAINSKSADELQLPKL